METRPFVAFVKHKCYIDFNENLMKTCTIASNINGLTLLWIMHYMSDPQLM